MLAALLMVRLGLAKHTRCKASSDLMLLEGQMSSEDLLHAFSNRFFRYALQSRESELAEWWSTLF